MQYDGLPASTHPPVTTHSPAQAAAPPLSLCLCQLIPHWRSHCHPNRRAQMYDVVAGSTCLVPSKFLTQLETLNYLPTMSKNMDGKTLKGSVGAGAAAACVRACVRVCVCVCTCVC